MASSSSNAQINAVDISSGKSLKIKPNTTTVPKDSLKVLVEQVIDFNSFMRNGVQVARFFAAQGLNHFFQIHHGPTYTELVKNFWVKASIFDSEASELELAQAMSMDTTGKLKTRSDFGLPEFKETEIRSNVMGVDVTITESLIRKLLRTPEGGMYVKNTSASSKWAKEIFKEMHQDMKSDKVNHMRVEHRVLYKIVLSCILPREGGFDQMSWDQKHLMLFLLRNMPVDVPQYIFNHLLTALKETQTKKKRTAVPFGRLISEILHQGRLIQSLEACNVASDEELGTEYGKVMNAMLLTHMNCGYHKATIVTDQNDLVFLRQPSQFLDDFPPISLEDNPEVIFEFVKQHFLETGKIITSDMIPKTAEGKWKPSSKKRKTTAEVQKTTAKKLKTVEEQAEQIASEAVKDLQEASKKKAPMGKGKQVLKRTRRMVVAEEEEEIDPEVIISAKGKGLKNLKAGNPKVFEKLTSGQAKEVQKLSKALENLDSTEAAGATQKVMKVKQEAGQASDQTVPAETQPGMPTFLQNESQTINLDTSSSSSSLPDDDVPISKILKTTPPKPQFSAKQQVRKDLSLSSSSSDSTANNESDELKETDGSVTVESPQPITVIQPSEGELYASQYVEKSLTELARMDPEFAVHLASHKSKSNAEAKMREEHTSSVLDTLSQHMGGELSEYSTQKPETEAANPNLSIVASETHQDSSPPTETINENPTETIAEPIPETITSPIQTETEADNLKASESEPNHISPDHNQIQTTSDTPHHSEPSPKHTPHQSPTQTVSEASPASEDMTIIEPPNTQTTQSHPEPSPEQTQPEAEEAPESYQVGAAIPVYVQSPSPETSPSSSNLPPPTLNLNPEIYAKCMAIFHELQELMQMKDLVMLPSNYHHLWETLRMKIDTLVDKIQESVMDSHLKAAKAWCDEVAAQMAEMQLKTDINRQFRSCPVYATASESVTPVVEITAPWVEDMLHASRRNENAELRAELEAQKQKQQRLEEKVDAIAAEQKEIKEQMAQNQARSDAKMDTMLEILMNLQKKP